MFGTDLWEPSSMASDAGSRRCGKRLSYMSWEERMYPSMSSGVTLDAPLRMKPAHTSSETGVHIRRPCAPYSACDRILRRARARIRIRRRTVGRSEPHACGSGFRQPVVQLQQADAVADVRQLEPPSRWWGISSL